jgi:hypothetical protein
MGVHVHGGTIPGGVTPICNSCGTSLCWDISKGEYQEDKVFWDGWVCQECNGGRPMRRADFRGLRAATTEHQDGSRFYTGVGSRDTPEEVLSVMRTLAKCLARAGYTLRSGGAEGADAAFESGAQEVPQAKMQIYLPWRGFTGNGSPLYTVDRNAMLAASGLAQVDAGGAKASCAQLLSSSWALARYGIAVPHLLDARWVRVKSNPFRANRGYGNGNRARRATRGPGIQPRPAGA